MAQSTKTSTAADVRAWAAKQSDFAGRGFLAAGSATRGRIPNEVQVAFNKAHRGAPYSTGAVKQVEVKVPTRTKSGRKGSRLVRASVSDLRAALVAGGVEVKSKGRLTADQQVQGAALHAGITLAE